MSPAALWYSVSENVTQSDRRRMPGEQILEHLSERTPTDAGNDDKNAVSHLSELAPTDAGNYNTLSLNQKNVRKNRPLTGQNNQNGHFVRQESF